MRLPSRSSPAACAIWAFLPFLSVFPGCADPPPSDGITLLSPRRQLLRLSVDLRGVHPTETELAAIEANPALYDDFVDRYLGDPRFLDRVESIWDLRFRTRTGETFFDVPEGVDEDALADAVGSEPLKLVRAIVEQDLPWSTIVTAPYTMADPALAAWWGIEREGGAASEGWQPGVYQDGRPMSGVLSMTTVWQRYPSAGVNSNRHRANQVARILLCDDYLARPVSFARSQVDALTSGDPEAVIRDNAVCQSCHSSLDPLAASFYGFWWEVEGERADQTLYRPEDEELWRDHAGRSPAFGGLAVNGLPELGRELAVDTRLARCATETLLGALGQRALDADLDWSEVERHREVFVAEDQNIRALTRSIVQSREYRAAAFADARADRIPTVKTVDPAQLAAIVEGITGYRWVFDGRDGLTTPDAGLVVLGGGTDGRLVTEPNHEPSVGLAFIQERLAWSAGWAVANADLDPERTDDARLLRYVTIEDTPDSAAPAFEAQIRSLYLEATGVPLEGEPPPEIATLTTLWRQLYAVDASPVTAWAGVVSVVLRDPMVLFY